MGDKGMESGRGEKRRGAREEVRGEQGAGSVPCGGRTIYDGHRVGRLFPCGCLVRVCEPLLNAAAATCLNKAILQLRL